ncbi:hypothetical protein CVT24_012638 [Panaeolus cyanescens]|uniref:Uncharacterized protein n=1 Tax=Panaeolus cyanescens TaxID=181874 RepID=A0A409WUJ5_9AGAR|nr:hypothetical protein CVT24_012638 [Panaeolus cyanescens]
MDTYGIYFASAIAATVVLRSLCGAVFPLFAPSMFKALDDQWAMSVFACLSTACMPIPLLFFKYGPWIRSKSRFAYKDSDSSSRNSASATPSSVTITNTSTAPCSESKFESETGPLSSSSTTASPSSYTASNLNLPRPSNVDSTRCSGLESRTITMSSQLEYGTTTTEKRVAGDRYLVYNPAAVSPPNADVHAEREPESESASRSLEKETTSELRYGTRDVEGEVLKRVDTEQFGQMKTRRGGDDGQVNASRSVLPVLVTSGRPADEMV